MSTDLLSPPDSASTPHPTHGSHRESEDSKNTLMLQTASKKSVALQQAEPEALKVTEIEEVGMVLPPITLLQSQLSNHSVIMICCSRME